MKVKFFILTAVLVNIGCLKKLKVSHIEKIFLGSISHLSSEQPNSFAFECPHNEILHLVIRLKSQGLRDQDFDEIRRIWESNYSAFVQIYDSNGDLIFSETFSEKQGNISTNGNWMDPDLSIILFKNIEGPLIPEEDYTVKLLLTGKGLEGSDLDLFLNRVYTKK